MVVDGQGMAVKSLSGICPCLARPFVGFTRRPVAYLSAHPELVEGRGDEYATHPYHIAASTAPGVAGSLVIGRPMAWDMAAPMAGSGGTIGTSPTPRTP